MEMVGAVIVRAGVMETSIAFNLARRRFGRILLLEKNTMYSSASRTTGTRWQAPCEWTRNLASGPGS